MALGAGGRYGAALAELEPLAALREPDRVVIASLACSAAASLHRQLGWHAAGRDLDRVALAIVAGRDTVATTSSSTSAELSEAGAVAVDPRVALFDARLGLAADVVGLAELAEARRELHAAAELVGESSRWWRQRVRRGWVGAEIALLADRPADAVDDATAAVRGARDAGAPRHLAKSLLFLGVAERQAASGNARPTLRRAASLSDEIGALPLVWPANAVLAELLADDPRAAREARQRAAAAAQTIGGELPADLREEWFARPDIAALLSR